MVTIDELRQDLTQSMKADDKVRVSVLRMLLSSLHNEKIAKQKELTAEDIGRIVMREIHQREESISEFRRGNREDLAQKEETELQILQKFQPEMMSEDEVKALVDNAVSETKATSSQELGKVMAVLMPKLKGKADGALVNRLVRERLSGQSA